MTSITWAKYIHNQKSIGEVEFPGTRVGMYFILNGFIQLGLLASVIIYPKFWIYLSVPLIIVFALGWFIPALFNNYRVKIFGENVIIWLIPFAIGIRYFALGYHKYNFVVTPGNVISMFNRRKGAPVAWKN
jgi:hypothetical protein